MTSWRGRLERFLPPLLAGAFPMTLLSFGVAIYILNHFYSRAPFLLDSGWYSAIVYRAGVFPDNPGIACDYAEWYYGVHVSPFVSTFSLLSYLSPVGRIEWYAFFQAMVYVPIGLATYAVSSRLDRARRIYRLPITILAALAFTFSGLVLATIGYPHYEAAIPGFMCLTLACVATGRLRTGWVMLALAASVREDAGAHTALALLPLLYLKLRGFEIPASRRRLVAMIAVAFGCTVVMVACQKLFFHSADLLRHEYLGTPLYAHITREAVEHRISQFLETCQFIYYPVLATVLVAALRRDPNYLLGWVVTAPWFALNFLAAQELKSTFVAYTGFPFLTALFWVFVYGACLAPAAGRMRPGTIEALFALVCFSSTMRIAQQGTRPESLWRQMHARQRMNRAAVNGFASVLGTHRVAFGRLYVDYAVAAIAIESMRYENTWFKGQADADAIAFHRNSAVAHDVIADVEANHLDTCTLIVGTKFVVCTRAPLPAGTFGNLTLSVVSRASLFERPEP